MNSQKPPTKDYPKISLVTPSFNQGPYLEETILSVLNQNYPNLEYYVIDGGSTDGSLDIIRKYAGRLSGWVSEPDRGQAHAINKGWQRCSGDLFGWLNSDDYLAEDTLHRVADVYHQHPEKSLGLIYAKANVISGNGNFLFQHGQEFNLEHCLLDLIDPLPQPSVFIPKIRLDEFGFLDENLHYAMDLDLFLRIILAYPPVFIDEVWSYARYTPETKTSRNPMGFINEHFVIYQKIFDNPLYHEYAWLKQKALVRNHLRRAHLYARAGSLPKMVSDLINVLKIEPFYAAGKSAEILFSKNKKDYKDIYRI